MTQSVELFNSIHVSTTWQMVFNTDPRLHCWWFGVFVVVFFLGGGGCHLIKIINKRHIKPQSKLAVRVWWSYLCYGFCQSRLPWLIVAFKIVLIERATYYKRTFDLPVVGVAYNFVKYGLHLQRAMPVGTLLPSYDCRAPHVK